MTQQEIIDERKKIEDAIFNLLTDFKVKTGVTCSGVYVHMVEKYGTDNRRTRVMNDVHLRCEL